jgi:surface antigen
MIIRPETRHRRVLSRLLPVATALIAAGMLTACTADQPLEPPAALPMRPRLASTTPPKQPYGALLGSFNGVNVYSNGSVSYFSNVLSYVGKHPTGYRWQCVEYVNRYYWVMYGRTLGAGNANSYYKDAGKKGLNRYDNGGVVRPQVGDILVSEGGQYGHVAIVREVGKDYVLVAQQNYYESTTDASARLTLSYRTTTPPVGPPAPVWTVGEFGKGYPVRGWLRP